MNSSISKYATLIDKLDRITGPLAFALISTKSKNLETLGYSIATAELLIKIHFKVVNKSKSL